ncbi:TetR/AcrR family transcriptional regulator [Nocardia sp. NPDC050697]|uniref:TetR/AcrR family transcriptional regulator n=1 Tax=Nocardia sp. NPDC050697 TaxID=3155158 RepID=UPI0033DF7507
MAQRTQAERRESTIAKLTDATIGAIAELGYPRATVQEIVRRAGVSQGALFRHFPNRIALIVHSASGIGSRLLDEFDRRAAEPGLGPREILLILRELVESDPNRVWRELEFNSRTDTELRALLLPVIGRHYRAIGAAADRLPQLAQLTAAQRRALAEVAITVFHGEAQLQALIPTPAAADMRVEMLLTYLATLGVPLSQP